MAQALAESGIKGIAILDLLQDGEKAARELTEQTGVNVSAFRDLMIKLFVAAL